MTEMAARHSLGVLMYQRKTELCQRLRIWIMESSMPALAAVVVALMRNYDLHIGGEEAQGVEYITNMEDKPQFSNGFE